MINNYLNDFKNEKNNFNNNSYNLFKNGYLSSCDDVTVKKMYNELNSLYSNVENSYKNIEEYWTNYIDDYNSLEDSLKSFSNLATNTSIRDYLNSSLSFSLPRKGLVKNRVIQDMKKLRYAVVRE